MFPFKRVVVTGGAGFLGSFVVEKLRRLGVPHIFVPRKADYDLVQLGQIQRLYADTKPDLVIHLAGAVGGIGINRRHPGSFFYKNLMMGVQLLEQARLAQVKKFVAVGTICSYPKFTPVPFKEEDLWQGYPEETNAPYGLAKKMMLVQSQAYRAEYGFNSIFLLPVNLYGPRDNFDPESSHVIPALIRKCEAARASGADHITCWGDGQVTGEFLHAQDCAEGILLAAEHYDGSEPVNVGAGFEISIRDLAQMIARLSDFTGRIEWDVSQPSGQPRRCLDVARAEKAFGFRARIGFEEGLKQTIDWYRTQDVSGEIGAETSRNVACSPRPICAGTDRMNGTRRALITGITGQDGSYLAEFLLAKGYAVHGVVRRASSFNTGRLDHLYQDPHENNPSLFLHHGDLADGNGLSRLVLEIEPDEIYNLGAQSHVRVSFDQPLFTADADGLGVLRMLEAARQLKKHKDVRFYQASSSEMYGKVQEIPQKETTPFYPRSPYGCAKVFAYHQTVNYREAYGLFACNGILFNHESPRRGETFVTRKITRAAGRIREGLQDKLYLGNLDAKRDWGYAADYVEAMWLMLQQDEPDDFVIATGQAYSVREFLSLAFSRLGMDWRDHVETDPRYLRPTEVEFLLGDATKARTKLGWKPKTSFEDLVELMVEADWRLAQEEGAVLAHRLDVKTRKGQLALHSDNGFGPSVAGLSKSGER